MLQFVMILLYKALDRSPVIDSTLRQISFVLFPWISLFRIATFGAPSNLSENSPKFSIKQLSNIALP